MNDAQRTALLGMTAAILAVSHCPPDLRFRAETLRDRLTAGRDRTVTFDELMRMFR